MTESSLVLGHATPLDQPSDFDFRLRALSLKTDTILSVARSNGRQIHDLALSLESVLASLSMFQSMFGTLREQLTQLIAAATQEPDENIGDLLRAIIMQLDALPDRIMESVALANGAAVAPHEAC